MISPYEFQWKIIEEVRGLFRSGVRRVLIQSATGSGKTVLASYMVHTSTERGLASWFVVHRRELIKQSIRTYKTVGIEHGVIAAGFLRNKAPLAQVAAILSLARRWDKVRRPKLIIIDECHHCAAKTWARIFELFPDAYFIGLTATPERLDGKGLDAYFQAMVQGPPMDWLIENKYLSPYRIYAPPTASVEGVQKRMGDYVRADLQVVMNKPSITGDAIQHYMRLAPMSRAIVRSVGIGHSEAVAARFNAEGIPALHVDGGTARRERDEAMRLFERGEVKVLSNVDLFSEGLDVPGVEVAIDLRPTQSLTLWLQFCGRALRYVEGKEAIILDHAGNCQRHGLPDEERPWSLAGREARLAASKGLSVRICSECLRPQYPGGIACKFCGHPFPVTSREGPEQVEGDLVEVDAATLKREPKKEVTAARTIEDLIRLGEERGYKSPERWASYTFNERKKAKARWRR